MACSVHLSCFLSVIFCKKKNLGMVGSRDRSSRAVYFLQFSWRSGFTVATGGYS